MSAAITGFLRAVERTNLFVGAALLLVSGLVIGFGHGLASMAIGVLLSVINFRVIAWVAQRIAQASPATRPIFFLLFLAKFAALTALTYVLIVRVRVDVIPFVIGVSTLFAVILVESYRTMLNQARSAARAEHAPLHRE